MSEKIKVDYIIVGQGLAGSAVAIQLLKLNKKILVIDQPDLNRASSVAAGLFNPITGKKMVKTWMADVLFPYLHEFYLDAEVLTKSSFFHPMPLYRPFITIEEQNEWMAKSAEPAFSACIDTVLTKPSVAEARDHFGGLMLKQCGYLDTIKYMSAVRNRIIETEHYLNEEFNFKQLIVEETTIRYKEFSAGKIIFCNGTQPNPIFNGLPVKPLKGETITLQGNTHSSIIINRGVYVLPLKENRWRVGATYNFNDNTLGVTESSRTELEEKINAICQFQYTVIDQQWGLRPTTPDRRPILGEHSQLRAVFIFNGLGTKGVSLAPYFSMILIRSTENQVPVNKEVGIERYKSVYSSSSL
ncbi:MAG TPA: FAD-dependent oxidoreductase [Chryseolinea sp.]|nr:FAD-dependent oxidoreductase [Chryseolinea sp.]HPH46175.1 FAD-dependent oxidoreductase [Chryseolinea sp.]HPM30335.1 FAD-dependent oxidoreductase [Chryseolinea sp.]